MIYTHNTMHIIHPHNCDAYKFHIYFNHDCGSSFCGLRWLLETLLFLNLHTFFSFSYPPFVSRMKLGHYDDPLWGHGADKLGHSLQYSPRQFFLHFSSSSKLGREDIFPHLETGSCWRCLFLVLLTILKWFEGFSCLLEVVWGFGCIWMHLAGFWSTIVWTLGKTWTKRDANRRHLCGWVCRNSW